MRRCFLGDLRTWDKLDITVRQTNVTEVSDDCVVIEFSDKDCSSDDWICSWGYG